MRHRAPLSPGPKIALQKALVRPVGAPVCPKQRIPAGLLERVDDNSAHRGVLRSQAQSPSAAQYLDGVGRVVPHKVEGVRGPQPLGHRGCLPRAEARVKIAGDIEVHLGVQDGKKSPDHGKHRANVHAAGQVSHVANVQVGVGTGEGAQVSLEGGSRLEVVIHAHNPVGIQRRNKVEVLLYALKIYTCYLP